MALNISNVINVAINEGGSLAQADNSNVVCVITTNPAIGLTANDRTLSFTDLSSVATAFGTVSTEYNYAASFFATSRNSVDAGGRLVFGFRDTSVGSPANPAQLIGGQVDNESTTLSTLQTISDGYFTVTVDGFNYQLTNLDFTSIVTIQDAVNLLTNEASFAWNGSAFYFGNFGLFGDQINNVGASSTISTVFDETLAGTYVGSLLELDSGSGAFSINGEDATPGLNENIVEAIEAIQAETKCVGFVSIEPVASDEYEPLAQYAQANNILFYEVFSDPSNLELQTGNPVWDLALGSNTNFRSLYSKSNNRRFAVSYMARNHSVNFNAENSASTMHLKELSISPESYTQTEIDKAQNVGLDVYTTIKNTPVVFTSGANDFADNRYNQITFIEELQVDAFNLLKGTSTKVPQTRSGLNQILDQLEKTTKKFVNAGVFGPGNWTSTERFGDLNTFNRSIETNGFYWKAGSLAAQSQADREARKSPVFQGAVKLTGAIHSADIIINFNK